MADVAAFGPTAAVQAITTAPGQARHAGRRGPAATGDPAFGCSGNGHRPALTDARPPGPGVAAAACPKVTQPFRRGAAFFGEV